MDPKVFGARLREARERLQLSQEELAAAVQKDQGAISEYESGKRKLAATDLPLFAQALNVSLLYFFEGDFTENDFVRAMLAEFSLLPNGQAKQTAIEIVSALGRLLVSL